jgi:septal ring factor EnvC (AmiA/AmiB activator)
MITTDAGLLVLSVAQPSWPSAVVAVAFFVVVSWLVYAAFKKGGIDSAAKMWGLLGTLVGAMFGFIPTYFFAVEQEEMRQREFEVVREQVATIQSIADKNATLVGEVVAENEKVREQLDTTKAELLRSQLSIQATLRDIPGLTKDQIRERVSALAIPLRELNRGSGQPPTP